MYILLPTIDMYIYKWIQLRNDRNSGALLILRMLIQSMRLLLILLLLLLLLFVFVKRIHVILLYVKCCSCAIRLVKQPKKAGTSQVVFLDWTLSWEVKKEQRKKKRKEEKTNQSMSIIFFRSNRRNQTQKFKTLEVVSALHTACTDASGGVWVIN